MNAAIRKLVVVFVALLSASVALAQERVVLVTSTDSPIDEMSAFEVRKIYLGIDVMKSGNFVRPLRNVTSPELTQIFLQAIVGLTAGSYERRLLNNLLRLGAVRPEEIDSVSELAEELAADPFAVTFAFDDGTLEGVKVLRVLWQQ